MASIFGQSIQYNPIQFQQVLNFIWYCFIGLIFLVLLIWALVKLWRYFTFKYFVYVYKKVGDSEIVSEDMANLVKLEGRYMFYYNTLKKYSPVIEDKYMRIAKRNLFGIIPQTRLGFNIYLTGESIFPLDVHNNPGLEPINLDLFNYMQSRIQANRDKYVKMEEWKQLLPYVALGMVILMFILGFIFWGKHIETISSMIISSAQTQAQNILQNTGGVQVIQ